MRKTDKPMFQHRHYVAIADILDKLSGHTDESRKIDLHGVIREMADMFSYDNDRFDRGRFEAAARGEPSSGRDKKR